MLKKLIEKIRFNQKYGKQPTVEAFLSEWKKSPVSHFYGYFGQELEWSGYSWSGSNNARMHYTFPDIRCEFTACEYSLEIGNIEGISMQQGGVVQIKHFALNSKLTKAGIGKVFFNAIIDFFKSKNATSIEFHENHPSKIEHYRIFFEKMGLEEVKDRVWVVNLYEIDNIPESVLSFHKNESD